MLCLVQELKELCDRKRWPQPQYAYTVLPAVGHGAAKGGATAVLTLPPAAGLGEVRSGVQVGRGAEVELGSCAFRAWRGAWLGI